MENALSNKRKMKRIKYVKIVDSTVQKQVALTWSSIQMNIFMLKIPLSSSEIPEGIPE